MRGNDVKLSGGDLKSKDNDGSSFYFTVDTCQKMAKVTNETGANCKTEEESQAQLNQIAVVWKMADQFFSTKTYESKG